jgi:hypothetical protein
VIEELAPAWVQQPTMSHIEIRCSLRVRLSRKGPGVRAVLEDPGIAQNFLAADREQPFLLPPDVREWLPEDHLAWFVIDAVGVMDTGPFYAAYREDGHGRAAYEPSMMIAVLLYCWARGVRSSRAIERACVEDVACASSPPTAA